MSRSARPRCARLRCGGDAGFTLPELLITTVILGVIIAAIGSALIVALRTQERPARVLGPSNDANILASHFTADVQSATESNVDPAAPLDCAYTPPASSANVVSLAWTDNAPSPPVNHAVAYHFDATARSVTRLACIDGGAPNSATVARNIATVIASVDTTDGWIELAVSAIDADAEVGDLPFDFRFRAYGRLASSNDAGSGGSSSGVNRLPTGALTGVVELFSTPDGTGASTPLSDATITVDGPAGSVVQKTGLNGRYYVGSLRDGAYTVTISLPGYAPSGASPFSRAVTISGGTALTEDFDVWLPVGSVSGIVSGNGGVPLGGVTVSLTGGPVSPAPVVTDATGVYSFATLPVGSYAVGFAAPAGFTLDTSGPDCSFTVADGTAYVCDARFSSISALLGGTVTLDTGGALSGVTVTLTGGASPPPATTDGAGAFSFPNLAGGSYTATFALPGHTVVSGSSCAVTVTTSTTYTCDAVLASAPTVALSGTVTLDTNGDKVGEGPQPGVTVRLLSGATVVATDATDASGAYSFTGMPNGTYTVVESVPAGFAPLTPTPVTVGWSGVAQTVNFVNRASATPRCALTAVTGNLRLTVAGQPRANSSLRFTTSSPCVFTPVVVFRPSSPNGPNVAVTVTGPTNPAYTFKPTNGLPSTTWTPGPVTVEMYEGPEASGFFVGSIQVPVTT